MDSGRKLLFYYRQGRNATVAMTLTEKILAAHANKEQVFPGELIDAGIDQI